GLITGGFCYYIATQINGLKDPEQNLLDIEPYLSWPNGLSWMGWTIGIALRVRRLGVRIPPSALTYLRAGSFPSARWQQRKWSFPVRSMSDSGIRSRPMSAVTKCDNPMCSCDPCTCAEC